VGAVDVSAVTFVDAAGLELLVGAHHCLQTQSRVMELSSARSNIARLLEIAGLARLRPHRGASRKGSVAARQGRMADVSPLSSPTDVNACRTSPANVPT
jgi:STAS domain